MDSPVQTKQHKKDASRKLSETDFSLKQGERWEKTAGEGKKKNFNMQHSFTGLETDVWVLTQLATAS